MRRAIPTAVLIVAGAGVAGATDGTSPNDAAGPVDGASLFARNCALCHQSNAAGLPNQYPRLAGRIGPIGNKPVGRAYLIDVVTYGMVGQITVDQQSIFGVMPALQLSDDDAARVLTYVESLGSIQPTPFTTQEVAAERAKPPMSATDVHAEREGLQSAKIIE